MNPLYAHAHVSPQVDMPSTLCENIPLADGALARIHLAGQEWVGVVIYRNGEQDRPLRAESRAKLLDMLGVEQ